MKTATSTAVVAITAKKTLRVPVTAAALGPAPSERRCCTLSSTTMASSTMRPAASTSARSVRILIENPRAQLAAKVPSKDTGMAMAGIKVNRIEPVKSLMVPMTTKIEMSKVVMTSRTEPRIKIESSDITCSVTPFIRALTSSTAARTPSAISIVLEPACRMMPMPTTRSPLSLTKPVESSGEKATFATLPIRI